MEMLMTVKPVLLWSDWLIFLLVLTLILFFINLGKNPVARKRWRSVFASRVGMASFLVIVFYVLIALLDSMHFRYPLDKLEGSEEQHYSQEVNSLLDVVLEDLRGHDEKTYSSPFAIHSFSKENRTLDNGQVVRDYPRLEHAGSHLRKHETVGSDVFERSMNALVVGLGIALVLALLIQLLRRLTGKQASAWLPWKTVYLTLGGLILVTVWILQVGGYYHILGTNKVGQDVLFQAIKAVRTGVLIGTLATLITLPIAVILGIAAGYFKGLIDDVVQYIYTTLSSIPGILLIAASVLLIDVYIETHAEQFRLSAERADFQFLALCFILGMTSWTGLCRLLRAETLKVSQLDYVQAARAFGVSHSRIIGKHILPNVTHIVLIALVLDFSGFVLAEAVLSYIGVGVDPSMASWGNMINEARAELSREPVVWWSVSAAFVMMFVLVLAANLFADRVRDAFDPRTVN